MYYTSVLNMQTSKSLSENQSTKQNWLQLQEKANTFKM